VYGIDRPLTGRRLLAAQVALVAVAAAVVVGSYLATHRYPVHAGGLFLTAAESIAANGWVPPETIRGYNPDGVPFAYPPLFFYVGAVLLALGLDGLTLALVLPGVLLVALALPATLLARAVVDSDGVATLTAVALVVTPILFAWHLNAGGWVRGGAFWFVVAGLWVAVRLFRDRVSPAERRRLVLLGGVLFGLTLLSHPRKALYFGVSWLCLFAGDRTREGALAGAAAAGCGVLVASPWYLLVFLRHGAAPFSAAVSTTASPTLIESLLWYTALTGGVRPLAPFFAVNAVAIGCLYLLATDRAGIPVWLGVSVLLFTRPRYMLVPAVLAAMVLLDELVVPALREASAPPVSGRVVVVGLLLLAGATTTVGGATYAASTPPGDPYRAALSDEKLDAAAWIEAETDADATVVGIGVSTEWLPYLADRTLALSKWGSEWVGDGSTAERRRLQDRLETCGTADCVASVLSRTPAVPTHLWVPKGSWVDLETPHPLPDGLHRSLNRSAAFTVAYANADVVVYKVDRGAVDRRAARGLTAA
jgi:hypothetical protein